MHIYATCSASWMWLQAVLDPHATLGVPTSASEDEVKRAYRQLALKCAALAPH